MKKGATRKILEQVLAVPYFVIAILILISMAVAWPFIELKGTEAEDA